MKLCDGWRFRRWWRRNGASCAGDNMGGGGESLPNLHVPTAAAQLCVFPNAPTPPIPPALLAEPPNITVSPTAGGTPKYTPRTLHIKNAPTIRGVSIYLQKVCLIAEAADSDC